jgi:hypothetical protein
MQVSADDLARYDSLGHTCFMEGGAEACAIKLHGVWVQFLRPLIDCVTSDGRKDPRQLWSKKPPVGLPNTANIPTPPGKNFAVETR